MRKISLLITLCCLAPGLKAASVPFPSGLIPLSSIGYESAPINGNILVVGFTTSQFTAAFPNIPLPTAKDQVFSSPVELAPGRFFWNVFVSTISERVGDFSAAPQPLVDPLRGIPFVGNMIPSSRFLGNNGLFAFEVGPQVITPTPEPSPAYLMIGAFSLLVGWRRRHSPMEEPQDK